MVIKYNPIDKLWEEYYDDGLFAGIYKGEVMTNITKCANNHCPLRETCYRCTAEASGKQAYAMFEFAPYNNGMRVECEYYLEDTRLTYMREK